ncbi:MAG: DUF2752 domain-containing protein [Firmicutes bacterium]|nr:DUF2752 domain-containing protein [Bacillota bacterium]
MSNFREIWENVRHNKNYFVAIVILATYYFVANYFFGYVSPTMIIAGLPCPACGFTRAGLLFFSGNFAASFAMHPLFLPTLLFGAVSVVCLLYNKKSVKYLKIGVIVLLLAAILVYIYRMINFFPFVEPLVVNGNSILHRILLE